MNLSRFFYTVKYLKPIQLYGRLWFKFYKPRPDIAPAPERRPLKGHWINPCKKKTSLLSPYRFRFLNQEHELKSPRDWNNAQWGKLWLYNLHYFDDLQACDAKNKNTLHLNLIEKWIMENPPGTGNGWEPYPTSLRIVNWIKWVLDGNKLSDEALHSLAVQVRYLFKKLEFHLLGNHLFANAKALIFAGLFFDGSEAAGWLEKGAHILKQQIPEQVLKDGGHFELSPMYHSIILEDILDIVNIMKAYGNIVCAVPEICSNSISNMMRWLELMCHPDGKISFFNDAALGIAPELKDLKAYAKRLSFSDVEPPQQGISHLSQSGYVRLQKGKAVLIADIGKIGPDYLPGHAHADTLSFEFSFQEQRVFVNSGISCYGSSRERLIQRGTGCHNTLIVDGKNSSDVWSGFRVAKRAYPVGLEIKDEADKLWVKCGHNGYERLKGKPVHWREWNLTKDSFEIKDQVIGNYSWVESFYHLYPGASVDLQKKKIFLNNICVEFRTDADVVLKDTLYYPEFGKAIPNQCLIVKPKRNEYFINFICHERCKDQT